MLVRAASIPGASQEAAGRRQALLLVGAAALATALPPPPASAAGAEEESIYDLSALYDNQSVPFSKYKRQVLLVLNVASA